MYFALFYLPDPEEHLLLPLLRVTLKAKPPLP
jgi:hypothetical protein